MARWILVALASAVLWGFLWLALFIRPSGRSQVLEEDDDMGLRARILKVTAIESGGPRNRNVLATLARTPGQAEAFDRVFRSMLEAGELRMYSDKRHALYGPPGLRWTRKGWVQMPQPKGRQ